MATESPIRIMETSGKWGSQTTYEEHGLGLKGQNFQEKQRNSGPNRSGSAPPSMEGSFAAIENLISKHKIAANSTESEEQLRADPSYFAYYSANVNLNPRLPPPLISDQNRHLLHNVANNSRFSSFDDSTRVTQSTLSTHKEEPDDDQSTKQGNFPHNQSGSYGHESNEEADSHGGDDTGQILYSNSATTAIPNSLEDGVSTSADVSGITHGMFAINMSGQGLNQSQSQSQRERQQRSTFQVNVPYPQIVSQGQAYIGMNQYLQSPANFSSEVQRVLQSSGFTPPPFVSGSAYMMSGNQVYPNIIPSGYFPQQYTLGGYAYNPPYTSGYLPATPLHMPFDINSSPSYISQGQGQSQHMSKFYGHPGLPIQPPFPESLQLPTRGDDPMQKQQHPLGIVGQGNLNPRRIDTASPYYFGSPTNMGILQFPNTTYASPPVPGSPIGGVGFQRNGMRSYGGSQVFKDPKTYSFLEELKSGKGRRLELSDIFGHIVEFCGDQHGSRFIQQKLETCSIEEKESVFKEVLPNASSLITDVFGNYVIQKFFEYGSSEQRRELANKLEGQILPLSLQMYGCRVIQKALDVIELEQKIKLVRELDGNVLRCVRDQNGNHVIQKCIESIPMEKIKFVLSSFRGQVAALSTHPYGCRVIQRVLEHSTDELQSQFIVDEILDSVYTLAQDQYGNYVTQHVLKRGKPEERSQIVKKLAGHIVELSQHKFASNVIEKCLEYGDSVTRGILIEEIIGLGDNSDNLLAMVKDQFANYVIQKVLQTCTGEQRELLLGRIKIHLNSLKKYTYGKHIVTRFEQLYGEVQSPGS